LQFDPEQLMIADDGTLRDAIDGNIKKVRRVSANAQPPLLPPKFAPPNMRGGRLPTEVYLERARKVQENWDFRHRISRLLAERYADQPPAIYVEQRIYDSFLSRDEEARLAMFHRQDWNHRNDLLSSIEDERYRELGERVIAIEQPELLTDVQRTRWQTWHRERILAAGDVPWLTVPDAMAELDELADMVVDGQRHPLSDIRNLLISLEAKCAAE